MATKKVITEAKQAAYGAAIALQRASFLNRPEYIVEAKAKLREALKLLGEE